MRKQHQTKLICIYFVLFFCACLLGVCFGSTSIPLKDLFLFKDSVLVQIFSLRFLGVMQAGLAGGLLALCGCVMQKVLRNPLADPAILGISAGGTCFAVVFILLHLSTVWFFAKVDLYFPSHSLFAFLGCVLAFAALLLLKKYFRRVDNESIYIVIGIILNAFFAAIFTLLVIVAKDAQWAQIQAWMLGSFQPLTFLQMGLIAFVSLLPVTFILKKIKFLNLLIFGDDYAKSLGVNPVFLRNQMILYVCVLLALVVCVAGSVGFVGLVVPHMMRKLHRVSLRLEAVLCFLSGASLLIFADVLSRCLFPPIVLPVGIFTALLGAPALALILIKKKPV